MKSIHPAHLPGSCLFWMPYAAPATPPSHLHAVAAHAALHNKVASPLPPCGKPSFEPNRLYSYSFHNKHNVSYCNQAVSNPPEGYFLSTERQLPHGRKTIPQDARDVHLMLFEMHITIHTRCTSHTAKVVIFRLIYKYLSCIGE